MSDRPSNPDKPKASGSTSRELPLVALRETVIFPEMIVPLQVGREKSVSALNAAVESGGPIALVTQRRPEQEDIEDPSELYPIGTLAKIAQVVQLQDGTVRAIVQGQGRLRVSGFAQTSPYIVAVIEELADEAPGGVEVQALMRTVQAGIEQYVANGAPVPPEAAVAARNITEPGLLADMVAYSPDMTTEQRQELLETIDVVERLKLVQAFLARQVEILELKGRIQSEVKSEMDKTQREYILREQLKAIQRELGEDDPQQAEINELRDKVEGAGMPDEIKARAIKEIDRMSRIPSASPEVGVIRTYVDWLVGLPWNVSTDDRLDIKEAAKILDEDHYGLEKIKERILEYLAVRALADTIRSPILALVGPPGVGKTSLGKSVARAMGRKFVRMSLGGIHDEAEIRGHRRTYIGALPGRVIQNIKTAGTNNPVFMLDEIDKIGMDFRGDPSSALLEVLDPEQNNTFQDNYLEVPFDLSKVLFIATGNLIDPIPAALRDRMEIIQLPGYTQQEKAEIGRRFLIPKQMENHGLKPKHIEITDEAMTELVQAYTHEAGVRNLEREIANIMRKVARSVAEGRKRKTVVDVRRLQRVPRPAAVRVRRARDRGPDGGRDRPRRDRGRRRHRRRRGDEDGRQGGLHPDRPARRGHARVRPGRPVLDPRECRPARDRARGVREEHPPHPRPRRRHPEGRPVGRGHDGHGHGQCVHRHPRPQGRGDDRRDHAPRPGPPDRRAQEQDPGRAPVGGEDRDPSAQEREGPARHPRGDPQADEARPRRLDGPGPRGGAAPAAEAAGAAAGGSGARRQRRAPSGGPTAVPAGRPAAGRRPARRRDPLNAVRRCRSSTATTTRTSASLAMRARPRSSAPSASSPGSTTRT